MRLDRGRIVCIGGATVDRKYHAREPVRQGTSNPVASERSFGGVARNVTENIARLGVETDLVSIVGNDENGRAVLDGLARLGIGTQHVTLWDNHATAEYVAVLQPDGNLAIGLADMAIFDNLTPALLRKAWTDLSPSCVFADCNLPPESLSELIELAKRDSVMLAIDTVSTPKARRLPSDLTGVSVLFLNTDEAQVLLNAFGILPEDAAMALVERGAEHVILTLGEAGLMTADRSGIAQVPAIPAEPIDATGAGDALIAAVLVALLNGHSLAKAVRHGTAAAALTIESPASVRPDLTPALLEAALSRRAGKPSNGSLHETRSGHPLS